MILHDEILDQAKAELRSYLYFQGPPMTWPCFFLPLVGTVIMLWVIVMIAVDIAHMWGLLP